jgi:hypothetical protein
MVRFQIALSILYERPMITSQGLQLIVTVTLNYLRISRPLNALTDHLCKSGVCNMYRRDEKIIQNAIWKTGRDDTRRHTYP